MGAPTKPPFRYCAIDGDVFLIRDAAPDLWQRVATFVSADRAADYVEVENMMIADFKDEAPRYETLAPPVLEPLPQSSVTVERITVRSSGNHADDAVSADITRRLADGESVRTVMAATGAAKNTVQIRRDALVEVGEAAPRRQGKPTLSPEEIEGRVQEAWKAIQELDAEGGKLGYATVAERAGVPAGSIAPAIKALVDRGLIQVFGHGQMDATELRERGGIRVVKAPPPADEEPPEPEDDPPPMGCILNAAEIPDFKRCWGAGDSMREMAEQFNLTTIEVADVRKKLGLPNRAAERLST